MSKTFLVQTSKLIVSESSIVSAQLTFLPQIYKTWSPIAHNLVIIKEKQILWWNWLVWQRVGSAHKKLILVKYGASVLGTGINFCLYSLS